MSRSPSPHLLLLILAAITLPLSGQPAEPPGADKPAWQWTWDERVTTRFDPAAAHERWIAYASTLGKDVRDESQAHAVIDGSRNPELFTPSELISRLLQTSFAPEPYGQSWRDLDAEYLARHDLGEDFWFRLEDAFAPILERRQEIRELAGRLDTTDSAERKQIQIRIEALQAPMCGLKHRALAKARKTFGREVFDRFLYETVARRGVVTGESTIADLIQMREGCR
jgi:hypothetical protein